MQTLLISHVHCGWFNPLLFMKKLRNITLNVVPLFSSYSFKLRAIFSLIKSGIKICFIAYHASSLLCDPKEPLENCTWDSYYCSNH